MFIPNPHIFNNLSKFKLKKKRDNIIIDIAPETIISSNKCLSSVRYSQFFSIGFIT